LAQPLRQPMSSPLAEKGSATLAGPAEPCPDLSNRLQRNVHRSAALPPARIACLTLGCRGVANYRIWAPWRLAYVKDASKDSEDDCVFCTAPAEHDDRKNLIVHRSERCFVILNKFPYTNGHLMVAPYRHLATLPELDAETVAEMMALAQRAIVVLDEAYGPNGYNAGLNQGRIAGAGFADHIHLHVVPRWAGDTNYMPVIADTRVMPQSLEDSYEALAGRF
jgi:ATP adenylyltransferase